MSDLIRREDVTRLVNQFVFGLCKAQNDEVIKIFNKHIEKIPTAYSVEKVVEELEEKARTVNVIGYGTIYEAINKDVAIEIVQQGGVSDDVCEWKLVSDGEFIKNPHTKRLYSNEPSMQNVYCNTCGKKIKIVGD